MLAKGADTLISIVRVIMAIKGVSRESVNIYILSLEFLVFELSFLGLLVNIPTSALCGSAIGLLSIYIYIMPLDGSFSLL